MDIREIVVREVYSRDIRLLYLAEYLLLQQTSFGGNLGKLPPNLVEFDCSYTLMSGGLIDDVFTGLNRLKYASLDGNFFNATVPKVLGQLPALEYLYIADSAIRGDLSYMKGGMPKIVEHWIDSNPLLIGTIPVEVNRLSTLRSLSLSYNGLSGSIPKQFGALSNLQYLWLIENSLSGSIPTELGQLRRLNTLQLEGNQLTGTMPSQVCANYDGGVFQPLKAVGADCSSHSGGSVQCSCCTCCSYSDCNS